MMNERIKFLRSIPFFKDMLLKELATISFYCKNRFYPCDALILSEGMEGKGFFIIQKGMVSVIKTNLKGIEERISLLKEYDFFGEMSLLENMPSSASVYAAEDTDVLVIEPNAFNALINSDVKVGMQLLIVIARVLAHRLRKLEEKGKHAIF